VDLKDSLALVVSFVAIAVSIYTWHRTQSIQEKGVHTSSMIEYQRMLMDINEVMLEYPSVGAAFEASSKPTLEPEDSFRLKVLVMYHLDVLELVHEYYENSRELSDLDIGVKESWKQWGRWLVNNNSHVSAFVRSTEFEDTYNPSFVSAAQNYAS